MSLAGKANLHLLSIQLLGRIKLWLKILLFGKCSTWKWKAVCGSCDMWTGWVKKRKKEGYSLNETSKPAGLGKGRMYAALSSRLNPWLQGQIGATFYRCTWANLLERPVHVYNVGLMNWKGIRSSFMRRYPIFMQLMENGVACVWLERWWGRKVKKEVDCSWIDIDNVVTSWIVLQWDWWINW